MISKELLSEALGYKIHYIHETLDYGDLIYEYESAHGYIQTDINIHELAHKCKEWAYENSYTVWSGLYCFAYVQKHYNEGEELFSCKADTEPEAIFKACEWILENKE
jgi:hypothetical protein